MRHVLVLLLSVPLIAAAADYTVIPDIEFTRPAGVSVKMDAHIPPGKGPFPTVVLVHGGGWTTGSKTASFIVPLFRPLTEGGFAWFSIDYRLTPEFPYTAQVDDVEAAVSFLKHHAKEYKVDPARIALMGESAGGYLVNLVGARNKAGVAAVVCFYGPIDMVEWSKRFAESFVVRSREQLASFRSIDVRTHCQARDRPNRGNRAVEQELGPDSSLKIWSYFYIYCTTKPLAHPFASIAFAPTKLSDQKVAGIGLLIYPGPQHCGGEV